MAAGTDRVGEYPAIHGVVTASGPRVRLCGVEEFSDKCCLNASSPRCDALLHSLDCLTVTQPDSDPPSAISATLAIAAQRARREHPPEPPDRLKPASPLEHDP